MCDVAYRVVGSSDDVDDMSLFAEVVNSAVTERLVWTEFWERMIAGGRLYMMDPPVRKELK